MMNVFNILGVLFVALKLMGYIDWAWIWVLSPFWIGILFYIVISILFVSLVPGGRVTMRKKKND